MHINKYIYTQTNHYVYISSSIMHRHTNASLYGCIYIYIYIYLYIDICIYIYINIYIYIYIFTYMPTG